MKTPKLVVLMMLVAFAAPSVAEFCKWVDENGVVHYAETCPEDVDSTEIETQATPTQEQVDEAVRRSGQLQDKSAARRELKKQEKEQKALARQTLLKELEINKETCFDAVRSNAILTAGRPVYFDENNELHLPMSLHSYWYEGEKTYLNDEERQAAIERQTDIVNDNCALTKRLLGQGESTYMAPPGIGKTMQMLQYPRFNNEPPDEVCHYARWLLSDWRKSKTGIPTTPMRELDDLIDKTCK